MAELLFGVLPPAEVLARVLLAMLLGGALGLERERKHRPAGLRTYMIVCMSSALVMLTGEYVFRLYGSGDPTRLAAQVISGIGFLGAGTIITTSRHVVGLTTAAALWASACIGLACGAGFYAGAVVCGGSDSDVTEPRPMLGIHAAVNRAVPQCAVSVEQAIEMYTVNGAYALFEDKRKGKLAPGYLADIVVLDRDIRAVPAEQLEQTDVTVTIKSGSVLHSRQ